MQRTGYGDRLAVSELYWWLCSMAAPPARRLGTL
jgi:hypothetical protein